VPNSFPAASSIRSEYCGVLVRTDRLLREPLPGFPATVIVDMKPASSIIMSPFAAARAAVGGALRVVWTGQRAMIAENALLFIEPMQTAESTPTIDRLTRKMCAAFRNAKHSDYAYGGVHMCFCGVCSTSCDYILPNGDVTNSLCIHYLAHHRAEVPQGQLARVGNLDFGEAEPTAEELGGPDKVLTVIRADVERRLGRTCLGTWRAWGLDVEGLCRGLQGGCLSSPPFQTPARRDAEGLFSILCSISNQGLPRIERAVLQSHSSLQTWGIEALRASGWSRAAWATVLTDLLRASEGDRSSRRLMAMCFRLLGQDAEGVVPALRQLADGASEDLRSDVLLALEGIASHAKGLAC
jgi:hypothetical protein